ncbi:uncharacterized protein SCHCODRAFT_02620069 [Schizophyllum commune H4-8]|nr:uncharacterized protein SCHCODRAFT_02620069 [Schizophyllum commune H4-8]KAI5895675.1 hypothetical protein SCHCODRAFT_02620069 [Schizophyllum commune H4-8]
MASTSNSAPTEPQALTATSQGKYGDLIQRGPSVSSQYDTDEYRRQDGVDDYSRMDTSPNMIQQGQEDYDALLARYEELTTKNAEYQRDLARAAKRIDALQDEMDLLLDAMQLVLPSQPTLLRNFPSSPPIGRRPVHSEQPEEEGQFPPVPPPNQNGVGSNGWNEANTRRTLTPPMVISIPAAPQESPNGTMRT